MLLVVGGTVLAIVHHVAGDPDVPERALASVAFGLPLIGAGVVAELGAWRGVPLLWIAAGVAAAPMAVVSVVGLPVLFPAIVLIVFGLISEVPRGRWHSVLMPAVIAVALPASFAVLVFHADPVTWSTETSEGYSSDVITNPETALTIAVVISAMLIAIVVCRSHSAGLSPQAPEHEMPPATRRATLNPSFVCEPRHVSEFSGRLLWNQRGSRQ